MARDIEEPAYRLVRNYGSFEVRDYAPQIVARTQVAGSFKGSLNEGFRRLARFIFGGNAQGTSIAMTAPVAQVAAPSGWFVTFSMPSAYDLSSLPRPSDARVALEQVPARRMAVLRFSGWVDQEKREKRERELRDALRREGLEPEGPAILAQYDPPWRLPFLRRNELQVPLVN